MDVRTAEKLISETNEFYELHAESFSSTRESPWDGWKELLSLSDELPSCVNVLDIGCGNLRFERFLANNLHDHKIRAYAFDSCSPLTELGDDEFKEHFNQLDIMRELESGNLLESLKMHAKPCSISVAFGFMHHIPLPEWRIQLLKDMIEMTKPGGFVCVSFWQISNSEKMIAKARKTTEVGCERLGIRLEDETGDYLLDWQSDERAFRYVHDFSDSEITSLIEAACESGTTLCKTYAADGRTGNLNRYVILKRDVD